MLQAGPIPQQILALTPEDLKQQFEKTSDIINSMAALLVGFCFFCATALSGPDAKLLSADPSIQLPFVQGQISFQIFLIIAPLTLLILLLYAHIYIEHWWHLSRVHTQHGEIQHPPIQPPLIFNLPSRLATATSVFILYLLGPLTLLFFCYEALKVPQTPSVRYGLIGFLTSLINGPRHALSYASCVIPPSAIAIICFGFVLGRRVIEPHALDWKWTKAIYRFSLSLITFGAFIIFVIALFFPWELPKFSLNLTNTDLSSHNLSYLDLSGAMLWNANLKTANLSNSNLDGAYLESSDLRSATFTQSSLRGTDLSGATMKSASFKGADLTDADFSRTDLTDANLCATKSVRARFDGATLAGVHWEYADLRDASFIPLGTPTIPSACLKNSEVVAERKCCGTVCLERCPAVH
jgi:hypothetical protein